MDLEKIKKKANDYMTLQLKMLKDKYKGKYKTPMQIKDKAEQKKFFESVKKEYSKKKS